jgi:hypothetical protein
MSPDERRTLLDDLHGGRTSRNREVERFARPECRRVLSAYRRVRALLREAARPGVQVQVRWLEGRQCLAVAVEDAALRYRRVLFLYSWEAAFLASIGGLGEALPLGAGRGS